MRARFGKGAARTDVEGVVRSLALVLFVIAGVGACRFPKSRARDAGASEEPRKLPSASTARTGGKIHAEIKGAIHHRKGDGPAVLEAGGTKDGLDPVNGIWGSGPNDVYAAAWDDPGKGLLHSKGDGVWTHESLADRRLKAVWGSGAKDVYVGGNDGIYHGHGDGTWKREFFGARGAISAIWGSSSKDIYAAGAFGEVYRSKGDGKWMKASVGNDKALLVAIWGANPNQVYVAGSEGKIYRTKGDGLFTVESLPTDSDVTALWGASAKDVYAVAGTLFHSTGDGRWESVPVPGLSGGRSLWGDKQGTLWVGASSGRLFKRRAGAWTMLQDKKAGAFQALWGTGDDLYLGAELFFSWTDPG